MASIEKPSPSLEKVMQKYFKLFAVVLIGFVIWRTFSPDNGASIKENENAIQAETLKTLVTTAVEDALNKRDIPVHASQHEPSVETTGDAFTIHIPKQALQASSGNIVVRNPNAVFTISFEPVVEKTNSTTSEAPADAVQNTTPVVTPEKPVEQPSVTPAKPE